MIRSTGAWATALSASAPFGRRGHRVARVPQGPAQRVAHVAVVVDDQEPGLHS